LSIPRSVDALRKEAAIQAQCANKVVELTFQVIRRTIATLAQKKGTVKDVQGLMRHSRTATTTDVYMQEIPESVQATVDAVNAELRLLPNLEEVTHGASVLLPSATKLEKEGTASS
jgi:integrase